MFNFSSNVVFKPAPCTSTLEAIAAFAAMALAILPLCHLGEACTTVCWKSRPCFGGFEPVFSARKSAFSAPKTWNCTCRHCC